jgi:hypothetical protein
MGLPGLQRARAWLARPVSVLPAKFVLERPAERAQSTRLEQPELEQPT